MASKYMDALKSQVPTGGTNMIPGLGKTSSNDLMADLQAIAKGNAAPTPAAQTSPAATTPPPAAATPPPAAVTPPPAAVTPPPAVAAQQQAIIEKLKITDDFGDEIEYELDLSNKDKLKEYVMSNHKLTHANAELDILKATLAAAQKELKAAQEKYAKFGNATSEEELADQILATKGGLNALIEQRIKERDEFQALPKEQQDAILQRQREKALEDKLAKAQKELDEKLSKLNKANESTQLEAVNTMMKQATSKYCPNTVQDPDIKAVHEMIWNAARKDISELQKTGVTLTQAIIDQKFQKAYMANKTLLSKVKGGSTNSMVDATSKIISGEAGAAGSQSVSSGNQVSESALLDKWEGMLRGGQGYDAIMKEVSANPSVFQPIFLKLAGRLRRRP